MSYTSGYWDRGALTLDEAAIHKYEKDYVLLDLKPKMSLLDIGCGWGSFVGWLNMDKNVKAVGVNLCEEQINYCKEEYPEIDFYNKDFYALENMTFDRLFSVGVLVHQKGRQKEYFAKCKELLKPDGAMLHWCRHAKNPRQLIQHCRGLQESYRVGEFRNIDNTLDDLRECGFKSEANTINRNNYIKTIEFWRLNMILHEEELLSINENEYYKTLRTFDKHIQVMQEGLLDLWYVKSWL